VANGPSVIQQVNSQLPGNWHATLLAVDGDTSAEVAKQLTRLPLDFTHLVLSAGGNDALGCISRLHASVSNVKQGLTALAQIQKEFEVTYQGLITKLDALGKPLLLCTIYDQVPGLPPELRTALGLFNDVIFREAVRFELPVLDLRMVCTEPDDYSEKSPIEPSSKGGEKMAARLVNSVVEHDFAKRCCKVYK
jgi:lysophospholipase L1-like esterase